MVVNDKGPKWITKWPNEMHVSLATFALQLTFSIMHARRRHFFAPLAWERRRAVQKSVDSHLKAITSHDNHCVAESMWFMNNFRARQSELQTTRLIQRTQKRLVSQRDEVPPV